MIKPFKFLGCPIVIKSDKNDLRLKNNLDSLRVKYKSLFLPKIWRKIIVDSSHKNKIKINLVSVKDKVNMLLML